MEPRRERVTEPGERRCEACGSTFGCGAEVGTCWCDEPRLDAKTLARLRETYDRCLCPDCLLPLATGEEASPLVASASAPLRVLPADNSAAPRGEIR